MWRRVPLPGIHHKMQQRVQKNQTFRTAFKFSSSNNPFSESNGQRLNSREPQTESNNVCNKEAPLSTPKAWRGDGGEVRLWKFRHIMPKYRHLPPKITTGALLPHY